MKRFNASLLMPIAILGPAECDDIEVIPSTVFSPLRRLQQEREQMPPDKVDAVNIHINDFLPVRCWSCLSSDRLPASIEDAGITDQDVEPRGVGGFENIDKLQHAGFLRLRRTLWLTL